MSMGWSYVVRDSGVDKGMTDDRNVDFPQSASPRSRIVISRGSSISRFCLHFSPALPEEGEDVVHDIKRKHEGSYLESRGD